MSPHARILLVGPHATLMGSVAARLEYEHSYSVVGVTATLSEATSLLARHQADILLLDVDGIEPDWQSAIGLLRAGLPRLRIILTCSVLDDRRVKEVMDVKAGGVLLKEQLPLKVGEAVREVMADRAWFPPELRERVVIGSDGVAPPLSSLKDAGHTPP